MNVGIISTFTGKAFDVFDPNIGDIDFIDIAHALSHICRFTGHVAEFYSVAEHSCWVHDIVTERFPTDFDAQRWALLHDAEEAYLVDVATPVKRHDAMSFYRSTAAGLTAAIAKRFSLPGTEPPARVMEVDSGIVFNEAKALLPVMHPELWAGRVGLNISNRWHAKFGSMSPKEAKREFLARFYELGGILKQEPGVRND